MKRLRGKEIQVVADSSFYICFLDDISYPAFLNTIFSSKFFRFFVTPTVYNEIRHSRNYSQIEISHIEKLSLPYDVSAVLMPFFGKIEKLKGEHEIIAIGMMSDQANSNLHIIMDETGPRQFLKKHFPRMADRMVGTVGFVEECHCDHHIISKDEAVGIIQDIGSSKFRISRDIVNSVMIRVREC